MDNDKFMGQTSLKGVLGSFIDSYVKREKSIEFSDWLESRLRQEMPDMPEEASKKLAGEIIGAVLDYDKTLEGLNAAVDAGQPKEEWLAEQLAGTYADMPMDAAGGKLQQIEGEISASNAQLMREIGNTQMDGGNAADTGNIEWNEYSVKDKAYQIGKQAVLSGMAVAANVVKSKVQGNGTCDLDDMVKEALQDALANNPEEVKATVAGAVKVAAEKGMVDIPDETIYDMAGVAVEGAGALFDAASGKSTMLDALEKIGRAGVAAVCRFGKNALKGVLSHIPAVGPMLVNLTGGLLDYMGTPKFAENAYAVVRGAAVAVWEGFKGVVNKGIGLFKELFS